MNATIGRAKKVELIACCVGSLGFTLTEEVAHARRGARDNIDLARPVRGLGRQISISGKLLDSHRNRHRQCTPGCPAVS